MEQTKSKRPTNLILVDCQYDFCYPDGALYVPGGKMIASRIAKFIEQNEFDHYVIIQDTHPENHCSFKENGGIWPTHCVKYTSGYFLMPEIESALKTIPEEKKLYIEKGENPDKEEYGAFEDTDVPAYMYIGDNVVIGVAGDFCVLETIKNIRKQDCVAMTVPSLVACIDPQKFQTARVDMCIETYKNCDAPGYQFQHFTQPGPHPMSVFDTDLYKFTTSYAYMVKYPHAVGTFAFCDRNKIKMTQRELKELKLYMAAKFAKCIYTGPTKKWLAQRIPYIPMYYWEWLMSSFRFDFNKLSFWLDDNSCLQITCRDHLYKSTLYEIPVLFMVAEFMTARESKKFSSDEEFNEHCRILCHKKTMAKIDRIKGTDMIFSEFGTRRRASFEIQNQVVYLFSNYLDRSQFIGTSNVMLAYYYDLTPIGTHPHEWFMFHGAQFGIRHANYLALEAWTDVYRGDLGIALTDTYTTDLFFENFSKMQALLFNGLRQDSGSEFEFIDKAVQRYQEHKIDPKTKQIVFSNSLNIDKCLEILDYGRDVIKCRFGIGTYFTHDLDFKFKPNIVMKLISCAMNDKVPEAPCIKISDDEGKHIGDPEELAIAMKIINQLKQRKQHQG